MWVVEEMEKPLSLNIIDTLIGMSRNDVEASQFSSSFFPRSRWSWRRDSHKAFSQTKTYTNTAVMARSLTLFHWFRPVALRPRCSLERRLQRENNWPHRAFLEEEEEGDFLKSLRGETKLSFRPACQRFIGDKGKVKPGMWMLEVWKSGHRTHWKEVGLWQVGCCHLFP